MSPLRKFRFTRAWQEAGRRLDTVKDGVPVIQDFTTKVGVNYGTGLQLVALDIENAWEYYLRVTEQQNEKEDAG